MRKKTGKLSGILMISAISIVGVFFLIFGIVAYSSDMYPYDIYISQPITLGIAQEVENQYLIQGEIKNKGEESITIQKLEFRCYNEDKSVHGTRIVENITIDAGQTYSIHEEIVSNGSVKYTSVRLYSTTIDDAEVQLLFSKDGKTFSNKQNELTAIVVGAIMLVIDGFMIYKKIKQRKVLNGKNQINARTTR